MTRLSYLEILPIVRRHLSGCANVFPHTSVWRELPRETTKHVKGINVKTLNPSIERVEDRVTPDLLGGIGVIIGIGVGLDVGVGVGGGTSAGNSASCGNNSTGWSNS